MLIVLLTDTGYPFGGGEDYMRQTITMNRRLNYDTIWLFSSTNGLHLFVRQIECLPPVQYHICYNMLHHQFVCDTFEKYLPFIVQKLEQYKEYYSYLELYIKGTHENDGCMVGDVF